MMDDMDTSDDLSTSEHIMPVNITQHSDDTELNVEPGFSQQSTDENLRELELDCGYKTMNTLRIPEANQSSLCQALLHFLLLPKSQKASPKTTEKYCVSFQAFFTFLNKNRYHTNTDIPDFVFPEFIQHLRDLGKSSNSITAYLSKVTHAVKVTVKDGASHFDTTTLALFDRYLARYTPMSAVEYNPNPSMSSLFNTGFSDTELIQSLRLVCTWILHEHQRQRELLLLQPEVCDKITQLQHHAISSPPLSEGRLSYGEREWGKAKKGLHHLSLSQLEAHTSLSKATYATLLKSVLAINDNMLLERVAQGLAHPYGQVLTVNQCREVIRCYFGRNAPPYFISEDQLLPYSSFKIDGKHTSFSTRVIIDLTFRHLIGPSDVEIFAAQCFFASEREQASNQARKTLADIESNTRGIMGQHAKGRSRSNFVTGLYPPNDVIEVALRYYVDAVTNLQSWLGEADEDIEDKLFPFQQAVSRRGIFGTTDNETGRFFTRLCATGTALNAKLLKDISQDAATPFLTWLSALIKHNNRYHEESLASRREYRRCERNGEPQPKFKTTIGRLSLCPDVIGQSRNYMKISNLVREKGSDAKINKDDEHTNALLEGHSLTTQRNIYRDRAPREAVDHHFARRVAELMEEDTRKIDQYLKRTQVLNIPEAKRLLGCEDMQDDIQSIIADLDEEIGLSGEIHHADSTVFVANDLTAALLHLRIEHITSELPALLNDTPSQSKGIDAVATRTYLEKVLARFPQDIQRKGKALSATLDIPFATLI